MGTTRRVLTVEAKTDGITGNTPLLGTQILSCVQMLIYLSQIQLTPFVPESMERTRGRYEGYSLGPKSPELYLDRWKTENGLD